MGFLDKLIGAVNKVDDVKTTVENEVFRDRRFERAEALLNEGTPFEATITGISGHFANDDSHVSYRLEWFDPAPRLAGVTYLATYAAPGLRLGSTVPIRASEDQAVIDTRLTRDIDGGATEPGRINAAPDAGIAETSLSSPVLSRFTTWRRERATVVSVQLLEVMGMATQNWTIHVVRAGGTRASVRRDFVPPYARWFVAPGADVPIVVDPDDGTSAQLNYPALATEHPGGTWRDRPPEGSVADLMARPATSIPDQPMATASAPIDLTPPPESSEAIEGVSIETCAQIDAGLRHDRVTPGGYDDYATANFEVPTGRYQAIRAEWETRIRSDWRVGAAYGEAVHVAAKALKKRR